MRFTTGRRTSLAVVFGVLVAVLPSLVDSSVAAPALADTACPAPTLTPDDPRAQWVEGTMALDDGATRDFYNRAAQLAWDNFMGDWADAKGTPQGSVAYATASLPDDDTPGPHTWNVTSLVREWLSGTPNQGFMLRQVGGAGPFDFYSKEHPISAERPKLTVNTSTGTVTLEPEADTHLDSSTYQGFGDETRLRISENPTLIRFDLSALPAGTTVNSATLQLWSYAEYGSSALEVGVFRVFHDPGPLPAARNGLAYGYSGDAGIAGDPDVYVYTTFTDASWGDVYANADSPNVALVSSAPGFEPLDGSALKVTIPAGENTGMSAAYKFADQTGSEPEDIYFRYYLRIDQSWDPTYGGKFPGISGTYGIAGWGGRQSDGTNGWSARGLYQPTVTGSGNPLDDTVPVGSYVYHAEQPTQYGDNVLWQDGYLGYLEKDRWYSVEQHLVLNTPGVSNGILETWIDGRLAYRQTNWRWRDVDSLKIEQIWLDFYHGGTDVPAHDISLYIDNVVIASQYIGPMTGAPCAPTSGAFIDDDGSIFEPDIEKIADGRDHQRLQPTGQRHVLPRRHCDPRPDGSVPGTSTRPDRVGLHGLRRRQRLRVRGRHRQTCDRRDHQRLQPTGQRHVLSQRQRHAGADGGLPGSRSGSHRCRISGLRRRRQLDLRGGHREASQRRYYQGLQPPDQRPLLPHQPGHPWADGSFPIEGAGAVTATPGHIRRGP